MPRGKNIPNWSPEEDATLTRLWLAFMPTKKISDHLLGRSVSAIAKRRQILALPRRSGAGVDPADSPEMQRIWKVLKQRPATRATLAKRAKVAHSTVSKFVKLFHGRLHVCGWTGIAATGDLSQVLKAGPGKDAPKPPHMTASERSHRWWERCKRERPLDAGHRIARDAERRREREGKHARRDAAAVALFGERGGA